MTAPFTPCGSVRDDASRATSSWRWASHIAQPQDLRFPVVVAEARAFGLDEVQVGEGPDAPVGMHEGPVFVASAIPGLWDTITPYKAIEAGAAASLRRLLGGREAKAVIPLKGGSWKRRE